MRLRLWVLVVFVGLAFSSLGTAQTQTQTPMVLHVTRSEMRFQQNLSMYLWGVIEGQKVQLLTEQSNGGFGSKPMQIVPIGNYPVRLVSDKKMERGVVRT